MLIIGKICRGKSSMRMCISGRQIDDLERLNSGSVTGWGGWRAGPWWSRLWSRLSASIGWRCTCSLSSRASLRILCSAIQARMAAGRLVLTKHCRVSFYRRLPVVMPRKLNILLRLFLDLCTRFLDEVFRFLYCGARKAFFGHYGHIQRHAHVGLFQLYPTSLPCHSCKHVENLQASGCCF